MTGKKETVNTLTVNSCPTVIYVLFANGCPQKKDVNPNCCQYQEIKHVNNVSCVDQLSFTKNVTNVPTVVPGLPVGARLHKFWKKWAALGVSPKVLTVLREGYTLHCRGLRNLTKSPTITRCYVNPHRNLYLLAVGGITSAVGQKSRIPGLLQPVTFGSRTQQLVETYIGPQYPEQIFNDRVIQNGDSRDNKNLPTSMGVGNLHRFPRRILPYTHTQSIQEIHVVSHPGSVLPIQSTAIWSVHSTHGVHNSGQRGQVSCTATGYKDPPVPRLVGQSQILPNFSPAYTNIGSSLSGAWLASEQRQIRTGSKTGFQLRRLSLQSEIGQGQTHPRALADPTSTNKRPDS